MQRSICLLFISAVFAILLPVTGWGYGFTDYAGDRHYHPYSGSAEGNRYPQSLRLRTGSTGDGYYVRAYLGGLQPDDVQVYLRRNRLVLQINQGNQYRVNDPYAGRVSRWQTRFRRQLRLPYDADPAGMTTSTKDGIMEIHIPRRFQYTPADPARQW